MVKITNETVKNAGWRSREFSVNHSKTITFGGWSKAEDVSSNALYALDFKVTFEDGSYKWYYTDTKFTIGTHDWEQTEVTKTFAKPVVKIKPYVLLYRGTGTVWFDDVYVKDEEQNENPQTELKVVETYTYDKNGNRKSATVNGTTINASYTLDDQLEVYGNNTYRYDDDGYLKEKTTPDGTTTYTYGTLGELQKVVTPTKTIEYLHNANNQRVAKKVDGQVVEKYLWANLTTLLAIYDADDNLVQRFEYADGRMPISMTQNGEKYYLHYDQVGTLKAVSNDSLEIIKQISYDTYGNILSETNPSFRVPFGFAGGLYDSDTKLTRFGFRDYDAYSGKWTAKDPIDFGGGDSNLYGYVLGNPVNLIDPTGEFGIFGAIIGAGFEAYNQINRGKFDPLKLLVAGAMGAVGGAGSGLISSTLLGAVAGAFNNLFQQDQDHHGCINGWEVVRSGLLGATGGVFGEVAKKIGSAIARTGPRTAPIFRGDASYEGLGSNIGAVGGGYIGNQ